MNWILSCLIVSVDLQFLHVCTQSKEKTEPFNVIMNLSGFSQFQTQLYQHNSSENKHLFQQFLRTLHSNRSRRVFTATDSKPVLMLDSTLVERPQIYFSLPVLTQMAWSVPLPPFLSVSLFISFSPINPSPFKQLLCCLVTYSWTQTDQLFL